jgi:hypothetical protein
MTYANFVLSDFLYHDKTSHLTLILHSISYYTSMYAVRWYNFSNFGRNVFYCVKYMNEIEHRR